MSSGRTLWDALAFHYQRGVDWVRATRMNWALLVASIDMSGTLRLRGNLRFRNATQSGGVTHACFTFRRFRSDRYQTAYQSLQPRAVPEYKAKADPLDAKVPEIPFNGALFKSLWCRQTKSHIKSAECSWSTITTSEAARGII